MLGLEVLAQLDVAQVAVVGEPRVVGVVDLDERRPSARLARSASGWATATTSPTTMIAGGRTCSARRAASASVPERGEHGALVGHRAVADHRDRVSRRGRPRSTSAAAIARRVLDRHHQHQRAAAAARAAVPVDQRVGVAGRQVAGHDGELVGDPAVGHRDPGDAPVPRPGWAARGSRVTGTPGLAARQHLLEAAAEHEVVAALEPHHPLAGPGAVDEHPVDLAPAAAARPRGSLATSTSSTSARSSSSSSRGASRSATTTSAAASACRRGDGDQLGVARSAADQHHAGRVVERAGRRRAGRRAAPSRMSSRSAADWRGSRLPSTATVTLAVPARRRRPRGRLAWRRRLRTQKIRRSSAAGEHPRVDLRVVGGRDDVPGARRGRRRSNRAQHQRDLAAPCPSSAGVTSGDTTTTSAPAAISAGHPALGHVATARPRRPVGRARRSPTGYGGGSLGGLHARHSPRPAPLGRVERHELWTPRLDRPVSPEPLRPAARRRRRSRSPATTSPTASR